MYGRYDDLLCLLDNCCSHNESTYDKYKRLFEESGLVIPKIIFWNVHS